jgi:hypothetical protein
MIARFIASDRLLHQSWCECEIGVLLHAGVQVHQLWWYLPTNLTCFCMLVWNSSAPLASLWYWHALACWCAHSSALVVPPYKIGVLLHAGVQIHQLCDPAPVILTCSLTNLVCKFISSGDSSLQIRHVLACWCENHLLCDPAPCNIDMLSQKTCVGALSWRNNILFTFELCSLVHVCKYPVFKHSEAGFF